MRHNAHAWQVGIAVLGPLPTAARLTAKALLDGRRRAVCGCRPGSGENPRAGMIMSNVGVIAARFRAGSRLSARECRAPRAAAARKDAFDSTPSLSAHPVYICLPVTSILFHHSPVHLRFVSERLFRSIWSESVQAVEGRSRNF
jgi:hypothetical protein